MIRHFIAALSLFFFSTASQAQQLPYKVGVVVPLTAASSAIGECVRNSVLLADEQRDTGKRVEFIFEDDGLQAAKTVPVVQKLLDFDKVNALIIYGTPTSLVASDIAEARRVPMIGLSILDRVVANKKYVMKHWVPSRALNAKIVEEVKQRKYQRVALVTALNDAMLALRDHFLQSNPAKIVLNEEVEMGDVDFRPLITKVRSANPDAIYVLLWPPQPGVFTKMLRRAGYSGAFFGAHNFASLQDVRVSEGAMEGSWFVLGDDTKGNYIEGYTAKYKIPPTPGGADGFDAASLMIEGINSGDLNSYLHTVTNFRGAFGEYGATNLNDFSIPAVLRTVKDGSIR